MLGEKRYAKTDFTAGQKETVACLQICFLEREKYLETVFFVEKEIFWREEIPGSKKEALKTVAYHEISFFWVREKIHIFLQKKRRPWKQ